MKAYQIDFIMAKYQMPLELHRAVSLVHAP
jgi:hypothetical protein